MQQYAASSNTEGRRVWLPIVNPIGRQPRTLRGCVAIGVLASVLPSPAASADILIESYRGDRPVDADRVLEPMRDELRKAGVKVRPLDVVAEAGEQLPLPGVSTPPLGPSYPADPNGQVELGATQVLHGDYDIGLATLAGVLEAAQANPGLVVADTSSSRWLTKAYAAVAFAQLRNHHPDAATQAVAEQIRSFPDDPIGRIVGPEVATLADTVRKTLDASPHDVVRITVSQPDVQVFLDEHPRGQGRVALKLVNAKYRLLLVRAGVARRYSVVVAPDRTSDLPVDWDADATFHATDQWVGFAWARGVEDKTEAAAARYARGGRQHDILVVSIVKRGNRRFVAGAIFEKLTGALVRRKAIALGDDGATCERALAQYLLKGDLSGCLVDVPDDPVPAMAHVRASRDPYLVSGIVAGAGAMSAISGIAVLAGKQDPRFGQGGPTYFSAPGVGLIAGGGLAIGVATYLATRASSSSERPTPTLRRSRAPIYASAATAVAAFVVGGYLLHINGTGTCGVDGPGGCLLRYRTTPYGGVLIGAGVAAAGFGVYWYLSAPGDSHAPALSLTPTGSGAMASLGGSF
jgi:hypothetical protein